MKRTILSWTCAKCRKYIKGDDVGNCPYCGDYRTKHKSADFYFRSPTGIAQRTDVEMRLSTMDESIETFKKQSDEKELQKLKEAHAELNKPRRSIIKAQ